MVTLPTVVAEHNTAPPTIGWSWLTIDYFIIIVVPYRSNGARDLKASRSLQYESGALKQLQVAAAWLTRQVTLSCQGKPLPTSTPLGPSCDESSKTVTLS